MKITLMIEGSATALATILASLPGDASVTIAGSPPVPGPLPMPTLPTGDDDDGEPTNTAAPAVDSTGLPWDERIHAKSKATNADGTWRKRKGVQDFTVAAVTAELRAVAPPVVLPPPTAMPSVPLAPPAPLPIMPPPIVAAPVIPPMPAPEPIAPPPPMPASEPVAPVAAPSPAAEGLDFNGFMQHLGTQMSKRDPAGAPLVHADYLASITQQISAGFAPQGVAPLSAITDIATNPAMITYAVQLMQRDGRW